jgi:hypothetical protein
MSIAKTLCVISGCLLLACAVALADWPCRTDSLLPIVTASGNQWNVRMTSDGAQGAVLVWQDRRLGTTDKLYVQRIDARGASVWASDGIPLASTAGFQYYPQIASDGAGGAFVTWQDNRYGADYDIFVQKISGDGLTEWAQDGILVCNASGNQYNPQIIHDSFGDIIIVWQDRRKGNFDILAQKYNAFGEPLWKPNGQTVCTLAGDQIEPKIVTDGQGGAIIAWTDYRSGSSSDIYVQHILTDGLLAWGTSGAALCTADNSQLNVQLVADGAGGAIAAWQDRRSGTFDNIYAQAVNADGQKLWADNGVALAPSTGVQYYPQAVDDGSGGMVVVWQDNRRGSDYDIYGQAIGRAGTPLWRPEGTPICVATGHQYNPQLVRQGSTVVASWQDRRSGDFDIYAQGLSLAGDVLWTVDGEQLARAPYDQFFPQMASDGLQGAIVAFADYHLGTGTTDIFAHRIGANGKPAGGCFRSFTQDSLSQKSVRIRRSARELRKPTFGNVRDEIFAGGAFSQGLVVGVERPDSAKRYGWLYYTKSYYARKALPQNGQARGFDRIFDRVFLGALKNANHYRYNNALSAEVLTLKLNIAASDLRITEPSFGNLLYKDTSAAGKSLNNKTLRQLVSRLDTMLTYYKRFPGTDWEYLNTQVRRINHAFEAPLDTISTSPLRLTPVRPLFAVPFLAPNPDPPPPVPMFIPQPEENFLPESFTLLQNYPNPFNPVTTIEFVLPEASVVTLKIYNMLGQQVAVLFDQVTMEDGDQAVDFDASRLSSGVYFYQVTASPLSNATAPQTMVKKMVLLK